MVDIFRKSKIKVNRKTFLSWNQTVVRLDAERIFTQTYSKSIKGIEYSVNINIDKLNPVQKRKVKKVLSLDSKYQKIKKNSNSETFLLMTKSLFEKRRKF